MNLTRQQIEDSSGIEADLPVSRQQEIELHRYYGWPAYWGGGILSGGTIGIAPQMAIPQAVREQEELGPGERTPGMQQPGDPHLRAVREVRGYHVQAEDGEIGHTDDLIADDESWVIRYLDVDTRNWLPGKHVLTAPQWVESVSWDDRKVHMALRKESLESAPEYQPGMAINRAFEQELYEHYGRPAYWSREGVAAQTRR